MLVAPDDPEVSEVPVVPEKEEVPEDDGEELAYFEVVVTEAVEEEDGETDDDEDDWDETNMIVTERRAKIRVRIFRKV